MNTRRNIYPFSNPAQNQLATLRDLIQSKPETYDSIDIDLSTARVNAEFKIPGDLLYVITAPATVTASIRFNEDSRASIPLAKKQRFATPFYRFFLTNTAQPGVTITLIIGRDFTFDFSEAGIFNIDQILTPLVLRGCDSADFGDSPITVDDTLGGTLIAPARAQRHSVTITNEGASDIRVGKAGVAFAGGAGALGGYLISSGGSMTFYYTGALYAICSAGLTTTVSRVDEYTA